MGLPISGTFGTVIERVEQCNVQKNRTNDYICTAFYLDNHRMWDGAAILQQGVRYRERCDQRFRRRKVDWLSNASYFDALYVGSGIWQSLGWGTIIYLAALSGVSPEMVEAAKIDGASRAKVVWHINIPTILPTIVIMLILNCGSLLGVGFEKVFALQNDLNLEVSNVISTYTYQIGLQGGQFSYASAIGLFNNIVNVIVLIFVNTIAKKLSDISIL